MGKNQHCLTSREIADLYPARGSMPRLIVRELYAVRRAEVAQLSLQSVVSTTDLGRLDRGARFMVASKLFAKCSSDAQHALLHDDHHTVRSAARLAYDGSYVENHCPECNEFESECQCCS